LTADQEIPYPESKFFGKVSKKIEEMSAHNILQAYMHPIEIVVVIR
jgi:hypothetical protein